MSGHALAIWARSKLILVSVLYCKMCSNCDSAGRRGKEPKDHECPRNYEGSSKGMKSTAALELVKKIMSTAALSNKLLRMMTHP